ncbi:hypothetical protein V6N12_075021 [Hibiscus sabdariffa]|uniref:Uncharacterized protein n=1 Tax=Hibiscus sabdariffa TaxID=183260 RepID=A0ABR2BZJ8_9ROSI
MYEIIDASYGNDDNGPNGPSGIDENVDDGLEGGQFGWSDGIVDEDSYEFQEDSGDSDRLGRNHLLFDDDDELNDLCGGDSWSYVAVAQLQSKHGFSAIDHGDAFADDVRYFIISFRHAHHMISYDETHPDKSKSS